MKIYWDSSALVEALHNESLRDRLTKSSHFTRTHTLSEVFSTLTGGRLGFRYAPEAGATLVDSLAQDLSFVDLKPEEVLSALKKAQRLGVRGGRVHDFLHAVAAGKVSAARIWTFNVSDFDGLSGNIRVESPSGS